MLSNASHDRPSVYCEIPFPSIGLVRIDRPERRNALSIAVKHQLDKAFSSFDANDDIKVIVLTGNEKYFVAGTDVSEMVEMTAQHHQEMETARVFQTVSRCIKPVIAAVDGYALGGGCELALACDIIIAGGDARFGQPEIRVGVMPGAGGTQRLLRTVGKYQTMKMILTGEPITAQQAFTMGMVSELVAPGEAIQRALALAQDIAKMPVSAVRSMKTVVRAGYNLSLDEALAMERAAFQKLFDGPEQKEGMRAFLEKRTPVYAPR